MRQFHRFIFCRNFMFEIVTKKGTAKVAVPFLVTIFLPNY